MPLPVLQAHSNVFTCFVLSLFNISKYTTFIPIICIIILYVDLPMVLTLGGPRKHVDNASLFFSNLSANTLCLYFIGKIGSCKMLVKLTTTKCKTDSL
jgi:hypothetical protein